MYTIDCEDSNCLKCRQASEGQHSEEENKNKIKMTVDALLSMELFLASSKRTFCLEACRKIKDEIHYQVSRLICVLKERERDLCTQVEQECCTQMAKIDHDSTVHCIDKLLKRSSEPEKAPCRTKLVFNSEFDFIFCELKKFGQLSYEDPLEHIKKKLAKTSQEFKQLIEESEMTLIENVPFSTIPLDSPLEAASGDVNNDSLHKMRWDLKGLNEKLEILRKSSKEEKKYFEESTDSVFSKEVRKDSSTIEKLKNLIKSSKDEWQHIEEDTDSVSGKEVEKGSLLTEEGKEDIRRLRKILQQLKDDNMEIISKNEIAAIPSELPPLPPKNRFKFGKKHSWWPSLYLKKPENNSASEHPLCCKTKSQECVTAFKHPGMSEVEELPSFNEQSAIKCSISHDSKGIEKSDLTASMAESKEIPSFNEKSNQASSSECVGNSNAEGQGHDPSAALLSSFKKYLEKNPECEWLVPEKNSEQSLSSGNSCIFNRHMPFLIDNLDQWLSTKYKQKIISDWLYTAQV